MHSHDTTAPTTKSRTDTRSDARKMLDRQTSEAAFQRSLLEVADMFGWSTYHVSDSRRVTSAGFPDIVIAHQVHGVAFLELKKEGGYLKPEQREWRDVLTAAGVRYYVFRPRDRDVAERLFMRGEWPNPQEYSR